MSIDINNVTSVKPQSTGEEQQLNRASDKAAARAETSPSSPPRDTVSLSENAVQLGKLESSSAAAPIVDTQRVEQLKKAINDGSYVADPVKIADKLMQFESLLKPAG